MRGVLGDMTTGAADEIERFRRLVRHRPGVLDRGGDIISGSGQHCASEFLGSLLEQLACDSERHALERHAVRHVGIGIDDLVGLVDRGRRVCARCKLGLDELATIRIVYIGIGALMGGMELPRDLQEGGVNTTTLTRLMHKHRAADLPSGVPDCERTDGCKAAGGKYATQYFTEIAPPVLHLHLHRGMTSADGRRSWKVVTKIKTPKCIRWAASEYRLHGVVQHHGSRIDSGHFTSAVWDEATREWVWYDDTAVTRVPWEYVESMQAYVLTYLRINNAECPLEATPQGFRRCASDAPVVDDFLERHRGLAHDAHAAPCRQARVRNENDGPQPQGGDAAAPVVVGDDDDDDDARDAGLQRGLAASLAPTDDAAGETAPSEDGAAAPMDVDADAVDADLQMGIAASLADVDLQREIAASLAEVDDAAREAAPSDDNAAAPLGVGSDAADVELRSEIAAPLTEPGDVAREAAPAEPAETTLRLTVLNLFSLREFKEFSLYQKPGCRNQGSAV